MKIPSSASIAVFQRPNQPLQLQTIQIPALQPGEILVRNEYSTLCRSDLHTYVGNRKEKTPTILGHEIVGRIALFGSDHDRTDQTGNTLRLNDRISWAIYASNPKGELSQKGIPQKEKDLFKYGHERLTKQNTLHGGLAEYTILRKYTPVMKVSESVPLPVMCTVNCAVSTIAGAMRISGQLEDKRVLVVGTGMLGMIACSMAKTMGAALVMACDQNQERVEMASRFGADSQLSMENFVQEAEPMFDLILEITGNADVMEQTLPWLAIGGQLTLVGSTYPQRDIQINAEQMVRNIWTIRGLHNYNEVDFVNAVQFIESYYKQFPFHELIFDGFKLDEVDQAFQFAIQQNPFRVGISFAAE